MEKQPMKKREQAMQAIQQVQSLFKCPLCGEAMGINEAGSMICSHNHCFDLSKKGYLNLLTGQYQASYSKELFKARSLICQAGFYDPLLNLISQRLAQYETANRGQAVSLLDAGCGEGSHLYRLSRQLRPAVDYHLFGIDISKDSIHLASSYPSDICWCVADLARLPFQNKGFDVVLNILSPANYSEFHRILTDEGMVMKVVPGPHYLKELRALIYGDQEKAAYTNEKVVTYFAENLKEVTIENLTYEFKVAPHLAAPLIQMTPLTWGEGVDGLQNIKQGELATITVDLTLMTGKKK